MLSAKGIFDFCSETADLNLTKLDRKQDLNVLYQVCVFRADQNTRMAALADLSTNVAHCTQVQDMWPFWPLVKHVRCSDWSNGTCIQVEVSDVIWLFDREIYIDLGK